MNLKKITDNDYRLKAEERFIGSFLFDCYDEEVGRIEALLVDPESFALRYALITIGGFLSTSGKSILLPQEILEPKGIGKVVSSKSSGTIRDAPSPLNLEKITIEEEQEIHDYFDTQPYFEEEESSIKEREESEAEGEKTEEEGEDRGTKDEKD